MDNYEDGWDTLINKMHQDFKTRIYTITVTDSKNLSSKFLFQFLGKEVRLIQLMKDDGKWEYFEKGNPLLIENEVYLKSKKITQKLNKNIIIEYLQKTGYDLNIDQFWNSDNKAVYFEQTCWE